MPWTIADVDEHKKGLSPDQKAEWCKIANGFLKACQTKGGSDCEASAIRVANSKVGGVKTNQKFPDKALEKFVETYGGEGSGNFGHAGKKGQYGGYQESKHEDEIENNIDTYS